MLVCVHTCLYPNSLTDEHETCVCVCVRAHTCVCVLRILERLLFNVVVFIKDVLT